MSIADFASLSREAHLLRYGARYAGSQRDVALVLSESEAGKVYDSIRLLPGQDLVNVLVYTGNRLQSSLEAPVSYTVVRIERPTMPRKGELWFTHIGVKVYVI